MAEECILGNVRVVIPTKSRDKVLNELHCGHSGVVRMKALARSYVWWPGIDGEVEKRVKASTACQTEKETPAKAPLHLGVGQRHIGVRSMLTLQEQ